MENRELTFEEFSKRLETMSERCGSCKFLTRDGDRTYCRERDIPITHESPRCEHWRYFA